jgi:hypothetical protein
VLNPPDFLPNENGLYECKHCKGEFRQKWGLKLHLGLAADKGRTKIRCLVLNPPNPRPIPTCEHCELEFKENWSVKVHQGLEKHSSGDFLISCPVLDPSKQKRRLREFPHLVKELHPTKNENITRNGWERDALDLTEGSNYTLWWKCLICNHQWYATLSNRTRNNSNCPACVNQAINNYDGRNSMQNTHPEIARELQGDDPTQIVAGTQISRLWKCFDCNHEWHTSGAQRVSGHKSGCPACAEHGFDRSKPAYVYQILFNTQLNGVFYKCGITNNEVRPRFLKIVKSYKETYDDVIDVKVVDTIYFESGSDAWNFELKLKASEFKLENFFQENFDGYTETFTPNILPLWDTLRAESQKTEGYKY